MIYVDDEQSSIEEAKWVRRPSGYILVRPGGEHDRRTEAGWKEVGMTLQCPHCGGHFLSTVGSGVHRTFCLKCMKVTCGNKECWECVPLEKKQDRKEHIIQV